MFFVASSRDGLLMRKRRGKGKALYKRIQQRKMKDYKLVAFESLEMVGPIITKAAQKA